MAISRRRFVGATMGFGAAASIGWPAAPIAGKQRLERRLHALRRQAQRAGIDPADMDFSVDPREDFYRYANGGWLDRTEIPASRGGYGTLDELEDRTTRQLLGLLANLEQSDVLESGSDEEKAVGLYRQGMDLDARNATGVEPIRPIIDRIQAIDDLESFHRYHQKAIWDDIWGVFFFGVAPDIVDSSVNTAFLAGPYFGLPNRDYYLEDTPDNEAVRRVYRDVLARWLVFAGYDASEVRALADNVYELERQLAGATLTREEQQDIGMIYNPITLEELQELYPAMDWSAFARGLGLDGLDVYNLDDPGYLDALGGILETTDIETLKAWLCCELMYTLGSYMSEDIENTIFAFHQALSGVEEAMPLEERVLDELNTSLPDALGQLYVAAYFPPESKERITLMVDELIEAFDGRLQRAEWMTSDTRDVAREKLAHMRVKVGYPDEWKTYEKYELGDTFVESVLRTDRLTVEEMYADAGQPVDRDEWFAPAQMVNAFYDPFNNDITFPAAILQPPMFDPEADPAPNFGGIGYVIGHEITHGFDDMGSQFDAEGNFSDWWTEEDYAAFLDRTQRVIDQYSSIEVLPGYFIEGTFTVGEDVADLGGVQVAWDALDIHLQRFGASLDDVFEGPLAEVEATPEASPIAALATPVAPDVMATPEAAEATQQLGQSERFFVAVARAWRTKIRESALVTQLQTDPHSPAEVRATMPSRNTDAFHDVFGTDEGDAMYVPPEERVVVW